MKIVVTGGMGFIGSHFVELALQDNHEILVLDKMTYAANELNLSSAIRDEITLKKIDISDRNSLAQALLSFQGTDCIVNFAAESHVDKSIEDSSPFLESNVKGTVNLLELVKSGLAKKMIQVSTDEVYGSASKDSWTENSPLAPRSPYSASKASAEFFCDAYRNTYGINIVVSRCANNYGSRQSVEKFIPTAISSILTDRNIGVYGDGKNRREWLHVLDHCHAIYLLMNERVLKNSHYNIGGTELSNNELARKLIEISKKSTSSIEYISDRLGHDFRYSVDDSRIRQELGWSPIHNLYEGLLQTYEWYFENPEWIALSRGRLAE
jgi:dTDP-glucose 4,6-dehydratase